MELNFVVGIFGEGRVGKTCIVKRFIDNQFDENEETSSNADKLEKLIEIEKNVINLEIYDLPGQESFHNFAKNYIKGLNGVILVYEIVTKDTFDKIDFWFKQMKENLEENTPILLLGNKCDLTDKRVVSKEMGEKLANEKNMIFCECSAKNGTNIENSIIELAKRILKEHQSKKEPKKNKEEKVQETKNNKKENKKGKFCHLF